MNSEKKDKLDECVEEQTSHKLPSFRLPFSDKVFSLFFWLCLDKKFFQNVSILSKHFLRVVKKGDH